MKYLLVLTLFISSISFAQKDKYAKLKQWYAEEKYEDCAYKAENMTMNDNLRKDVEPYLFLAMCNYKIFTIGGKEEEYPKAYSDALKFAGKAVKKDKVGTYQKEYKEFFDELKDIAIVEVMKLYDAKNYRKASGAAKKVLKFTPNDMGLVFFKAACDLMSANSGEGNLGMKNAMPNIEGNIDPKSKLAVESAFVDYAFYLKGKEMVDSARTTLDIGMMLIEDSSRMTDAYAKINN